MDLYHVTTEKKARLYRASGCIHKPVRGFTTLMGAMAWAIKTGRMVIYKIQCQDELSYKLDAHHNRWGEAWWCDHDVTEFKCEFSAVKDA